MDVFTAERCELRARRCVSVFQAIASGDFSEQWIESNLYRTESELINMLDAVKAALPGGAESGGTSPGLERRAGTLGRVRHESRDSGAQAGTPPAAERG